MKIENGRYSAGEFLEHWTLAEGGGFSRKRTFSDVIKFSQPFENPPKVMIAISGFDIKDTSEYCRTSLDVQAVRVSQEGFTVLLTAYADSSVLGLTVDWLAIGI